jgi:hypothetical protein
VKEASLYWFPLCGLVSKLRCWSRIAYVDGTGATLTSSWGRLLAIPTEGYIEAAGGLEPIDTVQWVQVSTKRISGGIAGRQMQMIDVEAELLPSCE